MRWTLLATLLLACATHRPSPASAPVRIAIALSPVGDATWHAAYRFSRPVQALRFRRGAREFARAQWTLPAGARIERSGETDLLRLSAPTTELALDVPIRQAFPPKDYQPFIRFGDGSLLLFTGQFNVQPVECGDPSCAPEHQHELERAGPTEVTIAAAPPDRVIVAGASPSPSATFRGSEQGTYAYLGTATPVQTRDVIAVSDRAMPEWLTADLQRAIPPLFRFYAERFGAPLPFKPELFVSYGRERTKHGTSFGGGTLPGGVVQIEVRLGTDFHDAPDAFARLQTFRLIAHESAHLWNAQLFEEGEPGEWLYEGGADAAAFRALRAVGVISDEQYRDELSDALSLCTVGWDGTPLRDAIAKGNVRNAYSCGSTLQLWAEALLHHADPSADLFTIWSRVFERARREGYSDATYWHVLGELPSIAPYVSRMRALVDGPAPADLASVMVLMEHAGIAIGPERRPPSREYERVAGMRAGHELLAIDCGQALELSRSDQGFRVEDATGCRTFRAGDRLVAVNGHALLTDGAAAYDAIAASCAQHGTVEVAREHDTLTLRCELPVPPRPPRLQVLRAP